MIPNIEALTKACAALDIPYEFLDDNHNLARVTISDKPYYFANASTPFNSDSASLVFSDKGFTHHVLKNHVPMPKTMSYVDPHMSGIYKNYAKHKSCEEIAENISKNFDLPVILKPYRGLESKNVLEAGGKKELERHLEKLFDQKSKDYTNIAIAQEKIEIKSEYRVQVFKNEFQFATPRNKKFPQMDRRLAEKCRKLVSEISKHIPLKWAGLDVAVDMDGKLWLIEINSRPGFSRVTKENINLYKKALLSLKTY